MKERPILFSAPMVRAILAGTKIQTRRILNPQPGVTVGKTPGTARLVELTKIRRHPRAAIELDASGTRSSRIYRTPYGMPGDRLWVRETWADDAEAIYDTGRRDTYYRADPGSEENRLFNLDCGIPHEWRPSIHMPRWRSRITLEITGVRVERLRAISFDDAIAEGWPPGDAFDPVTWYSVLWRDINGAASWEANPWVWVIEFRRIEQARAAG